MAKDRILISEYVSSLRSSENMNVRDFGMKYGISRNTVSRYELGKDDDPSVLIVRRFCKTFKINVEDFIKDFYYNDPEIAEMYNDSVLSYIKTKATKDERSKETVENFYDIIKNEYKLHDFQTGLDIDDFKTINENKLCIFANAYCKTATDEKVSLIYHPGLHRSPNKQAADCYSSIIFDIAKANSLDESELDCRNFIFIVDDSDAFEFLRNIKFNKSKNSAILALFKGGKKIVSQKLLYGEDFTK